jgi:D-cysteine desulfhydrase family pyridoxal phosphate-dependent enzyme
MWRQRLDSFARLPLAQYPTPLEPLSRLSAALGRAIYVKREDTIGPAMGGNKARKLEYLLAEAQEMGARKVVTFGGLQSNHARMTAAAACHCGLEPHLFFFERRPERLSGNLLLNELLGARMHFVPFGGGSSGSMRLETINRLVHWLARLWVGSHYFIPVGGHSWRGCLGYVRAAIEIHDQVQTLGIQDARLVVAAGSGGTLAGLLAGLTLLDASMGLVGIDVGKLWKGFPASIARMASELCGRLGAPHPFRPNDVPLIEGRYVGAGYAVPTTESERAIRLLAQLEGLILDPVYTGKACAGMLDLIEKDQLGADEPIIFVHTGGGPGLFASGLSPSPSRSSAGVPLTR